MNKHSASIFISLFFCFPLSLLARHDVLLPVDSSGGAVEAANRANDLVRKGDLVGARRMYDAAIRTDPKFYLAIFSRGEISMREHKYDAAIQDFDTALNLDHGFFLAAIKRGQAHSQLGHYAKALADYDRILSLQPMEGARGLTKGLRAWLRATCPDPAFRNGKQAVDDAKSACSICSWRDWDTIDTLAAAYAEAGDFDSAVKFEQRAISKAGSGTNVEGARARLALYQQHRPYREILR